MSTSLPFLAWRIGAAIGVAALTGCAMTPTLDRQFGQSVTLLRVQQVIDPAASSRPSSPSLDGETAKQMIDRYHKSYQSPSPPPGAFTIGVMRSGG